MTLGPTDLKVIETLANDLPVGLWVARAPTGEEIYANRMFAQIMGQAVRGDVEVGNYSQPYGILTHEGTPYPESRLPFVRALLERQLVVNDDIMIRRPDNSTVYVRSFGRPLMDAAGEITHVVVAFFDISEQVAAEAGRREGERRLQRAQRLEAVGTLAAGIAHDFNNLTLGIKLLAHELTAGEVEPRRLASLQLIDELTEKCALLTRSLLSFAGRGRHRREPIAVDAVLASMRELLARTMSGVRLSMELRAGESCAVIGDRSQLEQIIMNLVVNARDALASGGGGRVVISTRREGERLVLEVADDGPGIPAELRERVFEPYFTTKTYGSERGTGLGLATVFGVVDSHGGSVDVLPGTDGRGTTMRVTLPATTNAPALHDPAPKPELARGSGEVLVVDDDPLVRRALGSTLRGLGYEPLEANDGAHAVELCRARQGSLRAVVLDIVMPGLDGRAVFEAVRAIDASVAVLLLSGSPMSEDVQALLDGGARAFLMKPCSPEELSRALSDALARR